MATDDAHLSFSLRLDLGDEKDPVRALRSERGLALELDDGRRIKIDPVYERAAGYAQLLARLERGRRPVYVEVTEDGVIERLLVPLVSRLARVSARPDGGVWFELEDTSGSIFHFSGNQTDPQYTKTNTVLNTYRGALQARALNDGPPPYPCP